MENILLDESKKNIKIVGRKIESFSFHLLRIIVFKLLFTVKLIQMNRCSPSRIKLIFF